MSTEIAKWTNGGIQVNDVNDLATFANNVVRNGLAPRGLDTPGKVIIALQAGAEIGLSLMQSLKSICVINNQASIYGDALPALVMASGLLEWRNEGYTGEYGTDGYHAWIETKRRDQDKPLKTTFSIHDAKTARLWGKKNKNGSPSPWVLYPDRMLVMRARAWNYRDNFSDILKGLHVLEEQSDIIDTQAYTTRDSRRVVEVVPDDDEQETTTEATEHQEMTPEEKAEIIDADIAESEVKP